MNKNYPNAWVVSSTDRGRKSIKNGCVYLKDGEEFQIEIFNPLKTTILSEIKLNGSKISKTGLVVKPGQRIYLDCFLDDKRKFIFKTYEVDGSIESIEAIEDNGSLEVFFYMEKKINDYQTINYPNNYIYPNWNNTGGNIFYNIGLGLTNGTTTTNMVNTTLTSSASSLNFTPGVKSINENTRSKSKKGDGLQAMDFKSIETGRVEKGDQSNQKFVNVNIDFESSWISKTSIKMLPESVKPIEYKSKSEINESEKVVSLIKKLSELYKDGVLSEDEFNIKKSELLSRI